MTTFTLSRPCLTLNLSVHADRYRHGAGLAVELIDEEDGTPYATASVNVEGVELAGDEFVFKTYSENEGLLQAMLQAGVIAMTGRYAEVGFAGPQPVCRLLKR